MVYIDHIKYLREGEPVNNIDWNDGVFVPIDKPFEWTSFDVVNKLRWQLKRITGKKKFKVGHAGTLDPRATGLLIVACGRATKSIQSIADDHKIYTGVIQLGGTTPTYDAEQAVDAIFPVEHITLGMVAEAQSHFTGVIEQIPPVFSAIKKDGKRLYQYARKGQDVEIASRQVEIKSLKLTHEANNQISFECHCSKGTYIRSLAYDIGRYLNSGAYLFELQRTSIGSFKLHDAWNLEELIEALAEKSTE
jgi:tRNA pseudouridine55 synthase